KRIRVEMLPRLALIARSLNDVIEVGNDAGGNERMPAVVEVDPPRIARSFGKNLELVPLRVITPYAGVDLHTFVIRRSWFADLRMGEDAMAAVEPAVGSPAEGVQRLVRVVVAPAV